MNHRTIVYTTIAFLMSSVLLFAGFKPTNIEPRELYRVYIEGKSIGLIESKKDQYA